MAEIMEVFEDTTGKIKKVFKDRPVFFIACGAVSILALYKLYHSSETYYDEDGIGSIPVDATGYEGYPTMSESMLDYDALYEQLSNDMFFDMESSGMISGGGGSTSSGVVSDKSSTVWDSEKSDIHTVQGSNSGAVHSSTVSQMQANSETLNKTSSQAERDSLAEANKELGNSIGATYDKASGKWYSKNGTELLVYSDKEKAPSSSVLKNTDEEPTTPYTKVVTPNLTGNAQAFEDFRNEFVGQATYTQEFDPITQTAGKVSVSRDYKTNEYGGKNSVSVKGNTMTITQTDANNKVVSKTTQKVANPISTIIRK